jgi:RHS repeat-associated protein
MPDGTDLETTPSRAPTSGFQSIEAISAQDSDEVLARKFENVVLVLGDQVIKTAVASGDGAVLTNAQTLRTRIGESIQFTLPTDASEDFAGRLEQAVDLALSSQIEFLHFKALGAGFGAALGLSGDAAGNAGSAFAIIAQNAATSMREQAVAADPVTLVSGEFVYTASDLRLNGTGLDFEFVRTYKNQAFYDGPLGSNWDHSFNLWLRVTGDEQTIARSTGALQEEVYRRHEIHGYWMPPDGTDGVIVQEAGVFVWRAPNGTRYEYARDDSAPFLHTISRIVDRFGNYLAFGYTDLRLERIEVNHPKRTVQLGYDSAGKLESLQDHTGRVWRYCRDDLGDLVAVTAPRTSQYPGGLTTVYEYSSASFTGDLQHNLTRIIDPAGQIYLENEYGTDVASLTHNRIVRQRQGGGDRSFDYEDVISEFEFDYSDYERPAHQTILIERNGHPIRHVFNVFGNLLLREECTGSAASPRTSRNHYRYNRDGNVIGSLSAEGTMVQCLYGRDHFIRTHQADEAALAHDPSLTADERRAFSRPLTIVRRVRSFREQDLNLSRAVWGDIFPDIIGATEPDADGRTRDVIVKYTYESRYGQILTESHPRFTLRADPARQTAAQGEHERYQATLTRYAYDGPASDPVRFLVQVTGPIPTLADGTSGPATVRTFRHADGSPAYDVRGRLLSSRDAAGTVTQYAYTPEDPLDPRSGHLRRIVIDPAGLELITEFEVDALGRTVATRLPRSAETNDDRFVARTSFNELDQIIESVSSAPFSFRTTQHYNPSGLVQQFERELKDELGQEILGGVEVHRFCYDEESHLLRESIGSLDAPNQSELTHRYDAAGRRVATIQPNGAEIHYCYDSRMLPVAQTLGAGTPDASTTRIEYDGDGRVRRGISARGHATSYTLDALGRLAVKENALGHLTLTSYDKSGNAIVVRHVERREDGYYLLSRIETDYDELNRVIRNTVNRFEGALGPFSRDAIDATHLEAPGPGQRLQSLTFFDVAGRIERTVDPRGHDTRFEYDALGRVTRRIDALGNETRHRYDRHGNVVRSDHIDSVRDPQSGTITGHRAFARSWSYDELDRMISSVDSLGNVARHAYDSRANPTVLIDALGNRVQRRYDLFNRVVENIQAMTATGLGNGTAQFSIATRLERDRSGNVVAIVDGLGRRTEQQFDRLNRRRAIVFADGSEERFDYDADDYLTERLDTAGLRRRHTVDELGRTVRVDLMPDLVAGGETFQTFQYDGMDRCVGAENNFARCEYLYNSLGWTISETTTVTTTAAPLASPLVISREFNDTGVVTGLTYPNGRRIEFGRDALDRVIQIRNVTFGTDYPGLATGPEPHDIARFVYAGTQESRFIYSNGTETAFSYDRAGRLIEVVQAGPTSTLSKTQYLFDANDQTRVRQDTSGPSANAEIFSYDSASRLTHQRREARSAFDASALAPPEAPLPDPIPHGQLQLDALVASLAMPAVAATYEYDNSGNRRHERLEGTASIAYSVNDLDQYVERGGVPYTYDRRGNLLNDGRFRYFYDAFDRLIGADDVETDAPAVRYFHDPRGRRILEIEGQVATHLAWDAGNVISEYRDGRVFASYVHDDGVDRPIQIAAAGLDAWYHRDRDRSVRLLTDSSGGPIAAYTYEPFGAAAATDGTVYNPLRFGSLRLSETLGIYDLRARVYSPRLGRFLQRDPAGMVDGTNPYMYALNAPIDFTDPWGTESRPELNKAAIEAYLGEERIELARQEARRPQDERHHKVFQMYRAILDEIESSAISAKPIDLNGLWEKHRQWSLNYHDEAWIHMCNRCSERPKFADTGPFRTRTILGVDTVAVFNAVAGPERPNPSWGERLVKEVAQVLVVFGPGLMEGPALRGATANGAMVRAGLSEARAEIFASNVANRAGGRAVWLASEEGPLVKIRISGNRVTTDSAMGATDVPYVMRYANDKLGLDRRAHPGVWFSGTHGQIDGRFGGALTEGAFFRQDRPWGGAYGWKVRNTKGMFRQEILDAHLQQPTVYAWCYSSGCFIGAP